MLHDNSRGLQESKRYSLLRLCTQALKVQTKQNTVSEDRKWLTAATQQGGVQTKLVHSQANCMLQRTYHAIFKGGCDGAFCRSLLWSTLDLYRTQAVSLGLSSCRIALGKGDRVCSLPNACAQQAWSRSDVQFLYTFFVVNARVRHLPVCKV